MLDMALYAMGEPKVEAVSGASYNHLGQRFVTDLYGEDAKYEVEDFATSLIRLDGGRTLELEASWATYREDGDLHQSDALRRSRGRGDEHAQLPRRAARSASTPTPAASLPKHPGHPRQRRDDRPDTSAPQRSSSTACSPADYGDHRGREGLLRTWIIDAIYRSADEGREIRLEELKDEL